VSITFSNFNQKEGKMPRQSKKTMYSKQIILNLTGSNKKHLQSVASHIYKTANEHPLSVGGMNVRKVHVKKVSSTTPDVIFSGKV
jgi:ribosomal protein S10